MRRRPRKPVVSCRTPTSPTSGSKPGASTSTPTPGLHLPWRRRRPRRLGVLRGPQRGVQNRGDMLRGVPPSTLWRHRSHRQDDAPATIRSSHPPTSRRLGPPAPATPYLPPSVEMDLGPVVRSIIGCLTTRSRSRWPGVSADIGWRHLLRTLQVAVYYDLVGPVARYFGAPELAAVLQVLKRPLQTCAGTPMTPRPRPLDLTVWDRRGCRTRRHAVASGRERRDGETV